MKTAEIIANTDYILKDGSKFCPARKSSWKAASFEGSYFDEALGCWQDAGSGHPIHASQFVQTVASRDAENAERAALAAERDARDAARRQAEHIELETKYASMLQIIRGTFPEATVRLGWGSYGREAREAEVCIQNWIDYSELGPLVVGMAKILGAVPSDSPNSSAVGTVLVAVAAGLTPEPTGHTATFTARGDAEIAALATCLVGA